MSTHEPKESRAIVRPGVLALIAIAAPAALGLETIARTLLLPAELAQVRQELRPTLTPIAWGLLIVTLASAPLGLLTLRALTRRFLAKVTATNGDERRRREARFEAMFVATSVPQLPAILATFALTAGSDAWPVIATMVTSTIGVVAIGLSANAQRT